MSVLDFKIENDLNPNRLIFKDLSEYSDTPVSPTLHIKFPDFKKEYTTPIEFGTYNILNTERLGYTDCVTEFPDGVYELRFEINGGNCVIKKKVYVINQLLSKLEIALRNFDYSNKDLLEKYDKINLFLHGSQAVVCLNENQADGLYKQANEILKCL